MVQEAPCSFNRSPEKQLSAPNSPLKMRQRGTDTRPFWDMLRRVARILVVEDEPAIAESIAYALGKAGHETHVATCLKDARAALTHDTGLIVLDLMLPDGSGFDFIAELGARRAAGLAVIVLSSRDSEGDRVRALEMGADDYVTKPFSPREVVARVI